MEQRSKLADLYSRHGRDATRLAYLLTGDRQAAEDIAQEAFVKVAGRFGNLRSPDAFGSYLRRTVVNLSYSHLRKRRVEERYRERLPHSVPASTGGPETGEHEYLFAALRSLPARQRAAVVLRYCEDQSEEATARILDTTPKAVSSLVHRGLTSLRSRVEGERT